MAFPERWKQVLAKHMEGVAKGTSPAEVAQRMKAASAEYRGLTRPNPDYGRYIKGAVAVGFVWLILRAVQSGQISPEAIQEQMSGDPGI